MTAVAADTHAAVWYLVDDERISSKANNALDQATEAGEAIFVSAISLVELIYLVEKGRVPSAALETLRRALKDPQSSFTIADVNFDVADAVAQIPRDAVPDLPDRVIAATALALDVPLVSRDRKIRAANLDTVW